MFAAALAISAILLYVAWAFKNIRFGVAAVIALLHDLLVVLGSFSIFGYVFGVEVDTLFITAFLTTMSFSVHDTIVVFDRIREYLRRDRSRPFDEISDMALTETMNRSLTNSFTIVFMLVALILMGGETTKWFVVALLIGTISGTYSSPFVATPVLLLWHRWKK
jgi:preprotein translocase subunit SecF